MKTGVALLLMAFVLLAEKSITIEMKEKRPLKLVTYDEGSTILEGTLEVTIRNESDSTHRLLLWANSHNVLFRTTKESGVLVHTCDVVGYVKGPKPFPGVSELVLSAGQDTTILYDTWECSSPFSSSALPDFYDGGEYELTFRILSNRVARKRASHLELRGKGIGEIIKAWRELLHSEAYWKDAYESNTLTVRLKPRKK